SEVHCGKNTVVSCSLVFVAESHHVPNHVYPQFSDDRALIPAIRLNQMHFPGTTPPPNNRVDDLVWHYCPSLTWPWKMQNFRCQADVFTCWCRAARSSNWRGGSGRCIQCVG